MARALAAAVVVSLLAVSGAGGADAQTPRRGGTVVIQRGIGELTCFNPLLEQCFLSVWQFELLEGAYAGGLFTTRPNLVSGVDLTTRPPFTLTYHIRPEATWSDGTPVTAQDFVFTYNALVKYVPARLEPSERTFVRSVRALDAKTVRVVLRSRFAGWKNLFLFVLPGHALRGQDLTKVWIDRVDDPRTGRPIGSGPFLVQSFERGKRLTLVRNPRFWGPHKAWLDRIVVRLDLFGVPNIEHALRKGELDIVQAPFAPEDVARLRTLDGITVSVREGGGLEHLVIRVSKGGHPALRDKRVRRALAFGVDRAALVRANFGDLVPTIMPAQNSIILRQSPYYEPHWSGYRYRPQEARRLLEQAGCRTGADGVYVCAGERLSLRLVTSPARARVRGASLIQEDLRRVGIEVVPTFAPTPVFLNQILEEGKFDLSFLGWDFGPDPSELDGVFGCGGQSNFYAYCQRLVTKDLDQADRILLPGRRARVLNRADAQMARDVPLLPLVQPPFTAVVRSNIRGFTPSLPVIFWNAENWWLER